MYKNSYSIALFAFAALGVVLRISCYGRALWIDEAWVVNSALSESWSQVFFYQQWVQTTPPGLLVILRILLRTFDCAIEQLRWVPIVVSVATLLLFTHLVLRLFKPAAALLACAVLALSPDILWNGTEVKQFTFEILAMVVYLALGLRYIRQPSSGRLWQWVAGYVLSVGFAYTAMFCLPAIALLALVNARGARFRERLRELLPHMIVLLVVTVSVYFFFVRPNSGYPTLREFWRTAFPSSSPLTLHYFLRLVLNRLFMFTQVEVLTPIRALAAVVALTAGAWFCWRPNRRPRTANASIALLVILPVVTTLAANILGLYPVGDFRLLYFLVPCILLLLVYAFEGLLAWLPIEAFPAGRAGSELLLGLASASAAAYALCWSAGLPTWAAEAESPVALWEGIMDIRPVVTFLRDVDAARRPVFVHAYFEQLFKLYTRAHPLAAPVTYADSGWPCCIPGRPWAGYTPSSDDIEHEVARLVERFPGQSFYLLLTRYPGRLEKDGAHIYADALAARHCPVTWRWSDRRVEFIRAECGAEAGHSASSDLR